MPKKKKIIKKLVKKLKKKNSQPAKKTKPIKKGKILVKKIIQKPAKKIKKTVKKVVIKKQIKKPVKIIKKLPKKIIKKVTSKKPVKKVVKKIIKKITKKITKNPAKKLVIKKVKKAIIKKTLRPRSGRAQTKPEGEFAAESLFKAKIKVIGVGGGGGSIVSEIGRSLEKATFVIADTDIRALKKRSGMKYFWFGEDLTHGLGTGVNVDLAKQAAEASKEKISGLFKDQDIIIFVASLGGGLGSGATQVFAEAAKNFGGITFGIFTMPFKFEGKNKQRIAQNALKILRKSLNVSLVIPNEKIFKIIDESTPITNAFSTVNKSLIESLESLIDLIYSPGVINIDFADLRTILRGRGNSAFLNTIEASGKDSVEKICENIFKNPLLQNNTFKTEKILFNIAGGEALSMFQVEKISSHISDLNSKAKIIFGISKNTKLKNKIKTTILMTGASPESQVQEEADAVLKKDLPILPVQVKQIVEPIKVEAPAIIKAKKLPISKPKTKIKVFKKPILAKPILEKNKLEIVETISNERAVLTKKSLTVSRQVVPNSRQAIRRSGLEIKEAEELQEKKRIAQEKEWEIPAFLRKVKFKS
ncbi:MAG: cell division protein FtsZ [Candidatus Staskawiczbacteria bacterium]|jgi:cell division protein FtsZ